MPLAVRLLLQNPVPPDTLRAGRHRGCSCPSGRSGRVLRSSLPTDRRGRWSSRSCGAVRFVKNEAHELLPTSRSWSRLGCRPRLGRRRGFRRGGGSLWLRGRRADCCLPRRGSRCRPLSARRFRSGSRLRCGSRFCRGSRLVERTLGLCDVRRTRVRDIVPVDDLLRVVVRFRSMELLDEHAASSDRDRAHLLQRRRHFCRRVLLDERNQLLGGSAILAETIHESVEFFSKTMRKSCLPVTLNTFRPLLVHVLRLPIRVGHLLRVPAAIRFLEWGSHACTCHRMLRDEVESIVLGQLGSSSGRPKKR